MTSLSAFFPEVHRIQSISQSNLAVITTVDSFEYHAGLYVRIVIPYVTGMQQINGNIYLITILSSNSFSIPINSTDFEAFTLNAKQSAQVVPIAELNNTFDNAVENIGPNNP